jgi:hypothetical protein
LLPEEHINANPAENATETVEVDLNEAVEVEDSTADVNIRAALPPRGAYAVKWKAAEDGINASKTRKEPYRGFVGVKLEGNIQDAEFEGLPVYDYINSLSMRNKPTSDLHHFHNICGTPLPNRSTLGEIITATEELLSNNPVTNAELDWRASVKKDDGTYNEFVKTMTSFPKHYVGEDGKPLAKEKGGKWDNTYEQEIPSPIDGEPIGAQLYVRQHLTNAEAQKLKAKAKSA